MFIGALKLAVEDIEKGDSLFWLDSLTGIISNTSSFKLLPWSKFPQSAKICP